MSTPDQTPPLEDAKNHTKPGGEEASAEEPASAPVENPAQQLPEIVPILPLRGILAYPGMMVPLSFGRSSSLQLIEECLPQSRFIGLLLQRDSQLESPGPDDLYHTGVAGIVMKMIRATEDSVLLFVKVEDRILVTGFTQTTPYLKARVEKIKSIEPNFSEDYWKAAVANLRDAGIRLLMLNPEISPEVQSTISKIDNPEMLVDFLAGNLGIEAEQKQKILEERDVSRRIKLVQEHLDNQLRIAELQQKLRADVQSEFSDAQKRAYLREQMRAIQKELGEEGNTAEQAEELRQRLKKAQLPEYAMEHAQRELKRLEIIPPASPDHSVLVGYLETLAELPWQILSPDNLELKEAREILNRDHYGLAKVKKRLLEYLAVRKLNPEGHGPILCFLGPPGVGKTSIGQSIADALGRKFVRIALGGIRDEAEIRGHRRTYIGAMPGRIIQEIRRAGTRNPVFMLDEVDKVGSDFRGDPASALLEVLDPAQNHSFSDRYLDVAFDLSQIIFIATCNTLDTVPPALRDRMEVIELPGYTEEEKMQIAKGYLVKRQLEQNGLTAAQCRWNDQAIRTVIDDYTREAGVRNLERTIGAVCRSVAATTVAGNLPAGGIEVTPGKVREALGPAKFIRETKLKSSGPGVVTGLAYTPAGGEVLYIEALQFNGKGNVILTGQLGDIMKESVKAAFSLVRNRAESLGIDPGTFEKTDVHVHVPAGAIPKDGPSAGVAMFTALASLFSNRPVNREVAMTGEISLRGLVLPIGGLKEKTIAALRAGIRTVLIPKLNEKDIPELPEEVRQRLEIVLVETIDDVLAAALQPK